jgi:hypothetical protein
LLLPLSIGGFDLWPSDKPDPGNPSLPVCLCGIRPGLSFGFWEPVRLIDVTTKPFCFPNLGGLTINPGMYVGNGHVCRVAERRQHADERPVSGALLRLPAVLSARTAGGFHLL